MRRSSRSSRSSGEVERVPAGVCGEDCMAGDDCAETDLLECVVMFVLYQQCQAHA